MGKFFLDFLPTLELFNIKSLRMGNSDSLSELDIKRLRSQLRGLGFDTYGEFLSSDLWKEFRKRIYKARGYQNCVICKRDDKLVLHHKSYSKLLDPKNIILVCTECHGKIHSDKGTQISMKNKTGKKIKDIRKTVDLPKKPEKISDCHEPFSNWEGTEDYLKSNPIPTTVLLSLQSTFSSNPTRDMEKFMRYWEENQAWRVKRVNKSESNKAKCRLNWFNNDNREIARNLVLIWVQNFESERKIFNN